MRSLIVTATRREFSTSTVTQVIAFSAVYLIWGSTYLAILYAIESFPPFTMLGVRFGIAGSLLYGVMRWKGTRRPSAEQFKSASVSGVLMLLVGTGGIAWSEQYIPSGLAALLVATVPIWIILLEWIWLKGQRPKRTVLFALIMGLVAVSMVVNGSESISSGTTYFAAIGISLLAALSWSVGSLLGTKMDLPKNPFMTAALQMSSGGLALIVTGVLLGEYRGFAFEEITLSSTLAVLYLLVFGSLIAFTAFVWLLKHVPPARVATYAFVNPIVAVLLGTFIAGEAISIQTGLAAALLVTSVVLIIRSGRSSRASGPIHSQRNVRLQKHIRNRRDELRATLTTSDRYSKVREIRNRTGFSLSRNRSQSQ